MKENLKDLYKLGLTKELEDHFNKNYFDNLLGRVTVQYGNLYKIQGIKGEILGQVSGRLKYSTKNKEDFPAVGDWIVYKNENNSNATITNILPRKTTICRKVAGNKSDEQILATNVDKVFIAMSLNNDFNLRRLERYINIAWDSGATPIIILTKYDLCEDLEEMISCISKVALGIEVIVVSALSGHGIDDIKTCIEPGDTIVFIGSSGVGKSTLINKLLRDDIQLTRDIGDKDKGKHTTTHRELFILDDGGIIIDTPGMRELQLSQNDLEMTFKDIDILAEKCYFTDCNHNSEPNCAVKDAIENGELSRERFESYKKLQRELIYAEKRKKDKDRKYNKIVKNCKT